MLVWAYLICTNIPSTLIYKFPPGPVLKGIQIQEKVYTLDKYLENNNTSCDCLFQIYAYV